VGAKKEKSLFNKSKFTHEILGRSSGPGKGESWKKGLTPGFKRRAVYERSVASLLPTCEPGERKRRWNSQGKSLREETKKIKRDQLPAENIQPLKKKEFNFLDKGGPTCWSGGDEDVGVQS